MATGILIGFSEEKLLRIREKAEAAFEAGESIMNYSSDGVTINKSKDVTVQEALRESGFALFRLDRIRFKHFRPSSIGVTTNHGGQYEDSE